MNLPKSLIRYKSKISDFENDTAVNNGYWLYYAAGWKSGTDAIGCQHQDHEDTITELVRCVRGVIQCTCAECTEMLSKV